MAGNYIQEGDTLTLTAPAGGVVNESGYKIGSLFVVALVTAAEGASFAAAVEGVFTLPKTSAQAWTEGQPIYWDNTNHRADSDSTVGMLIGAAESVASNPSATGNVRLNCGVPSLAEGPQAAIAALTDSTGGSGTHDDTLADGLTAAAPAEITAYAAVVNMSEPVAKAEGEAVSAALKTLRDEVAALRIIVASCVTDLTTQNQNDSDVAQKILEIRTALIAAGIIAAA